MAEAYGFRDRRIAEQLRDFAGQLGNDPRDGMKAPPMGRRSGQQRTYWVTPKGTIPAASSPTRPGIGKGYICRLNRDAAPPELERFQMEGQDVEVDLTNYTSEPLVSLGQVEPVFRVGEDVFGDLAILEQSKLIRFRLCADLDRCGTAQAIILPEGCEDTNGDCEDCPDPIPDPPPDPPCEDVRITVEDTLGLAELAFDELAEPFAPEGAIGFAKPKGDAYEIVSIGLGCCEIEPPCPQIPGVPMEAIPVVTNREEIQWLIGYDENGCLIRVAVGECVPCEEVPLPPDEPPVEEPPPEEPPVEEGR